MEREAKKSDKDAMQFFDKSIQFKGGRYEVSLPWQNEKSDLCLNYDVAKRPFDQLIKKLKLMCHSLSDLYREVIQDYVRQGMCWNPPRPNHNNQSEQEENLMASPAHAAGSTWITVENGAG